VPLGATAWVSVEYIRGLLFGGFPWIPLGNTMITLLPVAQLASVGGVYALSLFVALVNAGFALIVVAAPRLQRVALAATLALVTTVSLWGGMRLSANRLVESGTPIKVGLIQANISQADKWNEAKAGPIVERYLAMTRQAVAEGAEVVLWPESATPFYFDEEPTGAALVRAVVQSTGVPLLFGTDEVERGSRNHYYNSAFMLDTGGATAAVYRKMHLVPFGEYVPFKNLLFFVKPLVESVSDFTPGPFVTMLPINGHMMSTAICYEVTYPALMRTAVQQGSELLTTITNDAWYGESSAPFQHFEMAAMRAIEQGRYLVRAANTGITGIVDPYGRVLARTRLGETTVVVGEARFVQARTLYATMGDRVAHAALALTALACIASFRRPWRSSSMI
jgi:apolipoprotein N-acyltransferase